MHQEPYGLIEQELCCDYTKIKSPCRCSWKQMIGRVLKSRMENLDNKMRQAEILRIAG